MTSSKRTAALLAAGGVVFALLIFALGGGASTDDVDGTTASSAITTPDTDDIIISGDVDAGDQADDQAGDKAEDTEASGGSDAPSPVRHSDLPTVTLDELPPEAIDVLGLIEDGGPYEYRQDDGIFQNREGILPSRERGHYREYTVETPGSDDRGARRIVAGADGERYWTDDHYASFQEIIFVVAS